MKRLLGLLLVMGMVGCGKQNGPPPGITNTRPGIAKPLPAKPNKPQAKVDEPPVQTVDASKLVQKGKLMYEGDSETPLTGFVVAKHENGQKAEEGTFKDGKLEGLVTKWYENGQKQSETTYKDGKAVSMTIWDEEGNEIK